MKKPTNVCIISLGSYPLFNPKIKATFGGAEVQLYLLAKYLAKDNNLQVHFIVGDYGQAKVECCDNVTIYRGPIKTNIKLYPKSKILMLKLLINIKADIIIQRSASASTGILCFFAHFLHKKFIYMTAHEIDCNGGFEQQNGLLAGRLFRYGIRKADIVITQCQEHKTMIKKHHKVDSVVMNSMYEIPDRIALRNITKKNILWVGRSEDWKRPEIFVDLATKFKNENFILIAPQSKNQPEFYNKLRKKTEPIKNLQFLDFVPFNEIEDYFRQAKIYILTSKYEGFPNTFVQAAKNKTSILSLKVNPDDFLNKYRCGYCTDDNPKVMENKFKILLENQKLREEMGENGYKYALENHNIKKIVEEYKKILGELV